MPRDKRMRTRRAKRNTRRNGGAATVLPLKYFNPTAQEPSADAGHDLLTASAPQNIRPRIGGGKKRRVLKSKRAHKGGFVPSVMDSFVMAASKYIVPLTLYAGYKMMTKKGKKSGRKTRKH